MSTRVWPTRYSNWSEGALYSRFRGEVWKSLDEGAREDLLQEVVNRAAESGGQTAACRVLFAELEPSVAGEQSGAFIRLNREMFVNDRQAAEYQGTPIYRPLPDANLRALETALHEDQHAWQNQVVRGEIPGADPSLRREYAANQFQSVPLTQADGTPRTGSTYLQGRIGGDAGYELYYFQATERDAHRVSEARTVEIMNELAAQYGDEPSFEAFRATVAEEGYDAVFAEACETLGVSDPPAQINQSLMNHVYGTRFPVEPSLEALVQWEMALSYDALNSGQELRAESGGQEPGTDVSGPDPGDGESAAEGMSL